MRVPTFFLRLVAATVVCLTTPVLAGPAKQRAPQPSPVSPDGHNPIPLPKDLTDNSNPFVSGATGDDRGSRYFQEQQNFRDQNPTRTQESDRIIRQFE
jgi:hypothetical protein